MYLIKVMSWFATVILLMSAAVHAEDKKLVSPLSWDTTMPAIELSNQPLENVLNQIKAKLPGFDFSIARIDVPHGYPVLPPMRVENVSLTQFFNLISAKIPGVEVDARTRGFSNFDRQEPDTQIFCYLTVKGNPNNVAPDFNVRVFGLSEIIAYRASLMKGNGDHIKQATDDILSLIQAALDEADFSGKPDLKLHPATQVLICKVSPGQEVVIEEVLKALQPSEAEQHRIAEETRPDIDQALKAFAKKMEDSNGKAPLERWAHQPATQP